MTLLIKSGNLHSGDVQNDARKSLRQGLGKRKAVLPRICLGYFAQTRRRPGPIAGTSWDATVL